MYMEIPCNCNARKAPSSLGNTRIPVETKKKLVPSRIRFSMEVTHQHLRRSRVFQVGRRAEHGIILIVSFFVPVPARLRRTRLRNVLTDSAETLSKKVVPQNGDPSTPLGGAIHRPIGLGLRWAFADDGEVSYCDPGIDGCLGQANASGWWKWRLRMDKKGR
ncbi:hypothetical protein K438DRAFT_1760908 [Mycena galopus ATCC 62051]|nr:hypothetical protein K438DRAFT_1760908 [Mycena galopus ATCC 62051]